LKRFVCQRQNSAGKIKLEKLGWQNAAGSIKQFLYQMPERVTLVFKEYF
jgi:hypothetical protein